MLRKMIVTTFLAVFLVTLMPIGVMNAADEPVTVTAEADVHVRTWKQEKSRNHGGSTTLAFQVNTSGEPGVGANATALAANPENINAHYKSDSNAVGGEPIANISNNDTDLKFAYIRFDLSDVELRNGIKKAELLITPAGNMSGTTFTVYPVDDNNWIEGVLTGATDADNVTENNSGGMNWYGRPLLGTTSIGTAQGTAADTQTVIDITNIYDKIKYDKVSVALLNNCSTNTGVHSKEAANPDYRPKLRITPYSQAEINGFDAAQKKTFDYNMLTLPLSVHKTNKAVTGNTLTLPTQGACGTTVSWATGDASVIAANGTVNFPSTGEKSVTLTATIGGDLTKVFEITVLSTGVYLNKLSYKLDDGPAVELPDFSSFRSSYSVSMSDLSLVQQIEFSWENGGDAADITYDGPVMVERRSSFVVVITVTSTSDASVTREYAVSFSETMKTIKNIFWAKDVVKSGGGNSNAENFGDFTNVDGKILLFFPNAENGKSIGSYSRLNNMDNKTDGTTNGFVTVSVYAEQAGLYDAYILCNAGSDSRFYEMWDESDNSVGTTSYAASSEDSILYSTSSRLQVLVVNDIDVKTGSSSFRVQAPAESNGPNFIAITFIRSQAAQPLFTSTSGTYASGATTATYTLTETPPVGTTYRVYADDTTGTPITGVSASASGTTLTLTFPQSTNGVKSYYIAAVLGDRLESQRTRLSLIPEGIDDADRVSGDKSWLATFDFDSVRTITQQTYQWNLPTQGDYGTNISWTATVDGVAETVNSGVLTVSRHGYLAKAVKIKATITSGALSDNTTEKNFQVEPNGLLTVFANNSDADSTKPDKPTDFYKAVGDGGNANYTFDMSGVKTAIGTTNSILRVELQLTSLKWANVGGTWEIRKTNEAWNEENGSIMCVRSASFNGPNTNRTQKFGISYGAVEAGFDSSLSVSIKFHANNADDEVELAGHGYAGDYGDLAKPQLVIALRLGNNVEAESITTLKNTDLRQTLFNKNATVNVPAVSNFNWTAPTLPNLEVPSISGGKITLPGDGKHIVKLSRTVDSTEYSRYFELEAVNGDYSLSASLVGTIPNITISRITNGTTAPGDVWICLYGSNGRLKNIQKISAASVTNVEAHNWNGVASSLGITSGDKLKVQIWDEDLLPLEAL